MSKTKKLLPKRGRKQAAIWHLVFSYGQSVYPIVSGILLVPLYLQNIPLDLYGAWLATGNILSWLNALDPGISTVTNQRVARAYGSRNLDDVAAYIRCGIFFTGCISLTFWLAGWIVAQSIPSLINFNSNPLANDLRIAFLIAVCGTAAHIFSYVFYSSCNAMLATLVPGIVNLIGSFGSLGLITILILNGWGLKSIAYGLLFRGCFSMVCNGLYLSYLLIKEGIFIRRGRSKIREVFGLLSFTSFGSLTSIFIRNADGFLLSRFLGPEVVPVFVLTGRAFNIAEMFLNHPVKSLSSSLSHFHGDKGVEKIRHFVAKILLTNIWLIAIAVGALIAFNKQFVSLWVGPELFAGTVLSLMMAMKLLFRSIFTNMYVICYALGAIKPVVVITIAYSLAVAVLLYVGGATFGMYGVLAAPLIGSILIHSWLYPRVLSRSAGFVYSDWKYLFRETLLAVGVVLVPTIIASQFVANTWHNFGLLVFGYLMIVCMVSWFVSPVVRRESNFLFNFLYRKLRSSAKIS